MKKALYEAVYDTLIAAVINFPLGYMLTKVCMDVFHMQAFGVALVNFLIMTVIAITRKTLVRLKFAKKDNAALVIKEARDVANV
jgi:hypothetical protein